MTKKDFFAMEERWFQSSDRMNVAEFVELEVDRAVRKARREERERCAYPESKHPTAQDLGAAFDAAMKRRAGR